MMISNLLPSDKSSVGHTAGWITRCYVYRPHKGHESCTDSVQCVVNGKNRGEEGGLKGELTTQQKQKKYTSHGSCKCSSPEVVVLDEYHVDGYVCCRCDECHDGRTPNMVLDLHCLQCQVMA